MRASILSKVTPIIKAFIPHITLRKTCFLVPLEFVIFLVLFGTFHPSLEILENVPLVFENLKKNIKILEMT